MDRPAVIKHDRPSFRELLPDRALGHSEGGQAVRSNMASYRTFEGESEAVGLTVADRKASDTEVAGVQDLAGDKRDELKRNRCPTLSPHTRKHLDDDVEGARAAM